MVQIKTYTDLPVCTKEVLRYAGCKSDTDFPSSILDGCIGDVKENISYKACYSVFDVNIKEDKCDFSIFSVKSKSLAKNLTGCKKAVVFAATVGIGMDRLISKYSSVSPSKAMLFSAIGAERIECLCDRLCEDIKEEYKSEIKPRFSPGYGDFDLSYQKDIFSCLNCQKNIGLTLTDSLIMVPSKSVTAVMGLCEELTDNLKKCDMCENKNCSYRGAL